MKAKTDDWVNLARAALAARDDLRRILPAADRLAAIPEAAPIAVEIRAAAWDAATRLRLALKRG